MLDMKASGLRTSEATSVHAVAFQLTDLSYKYWS